MALVEQLAFSLREEGRGVHALLWDDMGDLVRVLLITHAALGDIPIDLRLISGETARLEEFGKLLQARVVDQIEHEGPGTAPAIRTCRVIRSGCCSSSRPPVNKPAPGSTDGVTRSRSRWERSS